MSYDFTNIYVYICSTILEAVDNYKTHRWNPLIFPALLTLDLSMWEINMYS